MWISRCERRENLEKNPEEFLEDIFGEDPKCIPCKISDWILWVIPEDWFCRTPAEIMRETFRKTHKKILKK